MQRTPLKRRIILSTSRYVCSLAHHLPIRSLSLRPSSFPPRPSIFSPDAHASTRLPATIQRRKVRKIPRAFAKNRFRRKSRQGSIASNEHSSRGIFRRTMLTTVSFLSQIERRRRGTRRRGDQRRGGSYPDLRLRLDRVPFETLRFGREGCRSSVLRYR